jgi:hypothetical protein
MPMPMRLLRFLLPVYFSLLIGVQAMAQNIINIHGNEIEMSAAYNDSTIVQDPSSGRNMLMIKKPIPIKLNKEPIYWANTLNTPAVFKGTDAHYHTYLFKQLQNELNKLADGIYFFSIQQFVINKQGKPVYYVFNGLHKASTFNNTPAQNNTGFNNNETSNKEMIIDSEGELANPQTLIDKLNRKMKTLLDAAPAMQPALLNGHTVNYQCILFDANNVIQVKNHIATFWASENSL